jgi:hypothetical protein
MFERKHAAINIYCNIVEPEASSGLFSGVMSEPTGQDDTYSSGRPRTESNSSSMKTTEERSVSNII